MMLAARRVLVTGGDVDAATAALACDLAEAVGAAVDFGGLETAQASGPTIARIGAVTAAPAELRDRADLVVLWFCAHDPAAKPFLDRFVPPATGPGRPRRTMSVGPHAIAAHGAAPDHVVAPRAAALDLARLMHAAVAGVAVPGPPATLAAACATLETAIGAAECVAFVTGHDDPVGLEPWSLVGLVRALAHVKPAFEVPLTGRAVAGDVCTWRYGAAGAIARADRMGGVFGPAEDDARRLVTRGEVDCVVAIGPLDNAVEAAITARGAGLAVIRVDATSLPPLLRDVRAALGEGGRP